MFYSGVCSRRDLQQVAPIWFRLRTQIARYMWPTWGPPGSPSGSHVGPTNLAIREEMSWILEGHSSFILRRIVKWGIIKKNAIHITVHLYYICGIQNRFVILPNKMESREYRKIQICDLLCFVGLLSTDLIPKNQGPWKNRKGWSIQAAVSFHSLNPRNLTRATHISTNDYHARSL